MSLATHASPKLPMHEDRDGQTSDRASLCTSTAAQCGQPNSDNKMFLTMVRLALLAMVFAATTAVPLQHTEHPEHKHINPDIKITGSVDRFQYSYYETPVTNVTETPYVDVSFNVTDGQIKIYAKQGAGLYPNETDYDFHFTDLSSAWDFFTLDNDVVWSFAVYGYSSATFDIYRSTKYIQPLHEGFTADAMTDKQYKTKWWIIEVPANVQTLAIKLYGTESKGSNLHIADYDLGLNPDVPEFGTHNKFEVHTTSFPYLTTCLRVTNPTPGRYFVNTALVRSPYRNSPSKIRYGFNDQAPCT